MTVLNLRTSGTRAALLSTGLKQKRRIGRGQFCAVYDNEDGTVSKLTVDSVSFEGVRSYFHSPHLPSMIDNHGIVGSQYLLANEDADLSLYLFTTKKLQKIQQADLTTQRLAKKLCKLSESKSCDAADKVRSTRPALCRRWPEYQNNVSREAFLLLSLSDELPKELREPFEQLYRYACDHDSLSIDLDRQNLMVDDDGRLILNDVICDVRFL